MFCDEGTARVTTTNPVTVCFVEDDEALREAMMQSLQLDNITVEAFDSAPPALRRLSAKFAGVVVSDVRLPGMDGLQLFEALHEIDPELPVIFTTGHGDVAMAVAAMKAGASDFLTKPYSATALIEAVRRASSKRELVLENRMLREALRDRSATGLIGTSDVTRRLDRLIGEVARSEIDIVLTGASGTGKTYLARRIHELSKRHSRPFVTLDAAIWTHPDAELIIFGRDRSAGLSRSGLIERAQGGTLLLDDVDTVPEHLRGRVSGLLEHRSYLAQGADRTRKVDLRCIATAGPDVTPSSESLLRRLGGISIALPTLSERQDDIPQIFRHFIAQFEGELQITARDIGLAEWSYLLGYDWPSNIRELRDFARNFVLGLTSSSAIDRTPAPRRSLRDLTANFERSVLEDALRACGGRTGEVAKRLSVRRKTLYDKLSRHGLTPSDFRK